MVNGSGVLYRESRQSLDTHQLRISAAAQHGCGHAQVVNVKDEGSPCFQIAEVTSPDPRGLVGFLGHLAGHQAGRFRKTSGASCARLMRTSSTWI